MNYTKLSGILCLCLSVLYSCTQEDLPKPEEVKTITVYAGDVNSDTKTALDNLTVNWVVNDVIHVYADDLCSTTTSTCITAGNPAKFTFSAPSTATSGYYSIYPKKTQSADGSQSYSPYLEHSSSGYEIKGHCIVFSSQRALADGFDPSSAPMLGKAGLSTDFHFANIASFLRFNVSGEGIAKIVLSDNAGTANLAGSFVMECADNDGDGKFDTFLKGEETKPQGVSSSITLLPPTGSTTFPAGTYCVAVCPDVTCTGGFSLTYYDSSESEIQKATSSASVTLNRGSVRSVNGPRDYYVTTSGDASSKGMSWDAPTTLDYALGAASSGSTIHIGAGTYQPAMALKGYTGSDAKYNTFEISRNVKLIGGYPESPSAGAESDPSTNLTKLDGNGAVYHTVCVTAVPVTGRTVSINGLTITGGDGSAAGSTSVTSTVNGKKYSDNYAAGIYAIGATLEIDDCIITANKGKSAAGAFFNGCTVQIKNSTCSNNTGSSNGTGMWFNNSESSMQNCCVAGNTTSGVGAGVYVYTDSGESTLSVNNCEFSGNVAETGRGGAMYARAATKGTTTLNVANCTFFGNKAGHFGSAIAFFATATTPVAANIFSSTFTGNESTGTHTERGGALGFETAGITCIIYNSIVSGNSYAAAPTLADISYLSAGAKSYKMNKSIIGTVTYDAASAAVEEAPAFDPATMLSAVAKTSPFTQVYKLTGSSNPATSYGMLVADLKTAGAAFFSADVLGADQCGNSRSDSVMGSYVE